MARFSMPSRPRRRGWWTGLLVLAAAGAFVAGGPGGREGKGVSGERGTAPADGVSGRVVDVIDGDTIAVELAGGRSEHIRYIGVDTPESTPNQPLECFGHEAAEENAKLVGGEVVRLRFGPERRDDYGRLLAYVYVGRVFVNAELVERGFARTLTISPNDERAPLLTRLEAAAGRGAVGLWGACNK